MQTPELNQNLEKSKLYNLVEKKWITLGSKAIIEKEIEIAFRIYLDKKAKCSYRDVVEPYLARPELALARLGSARFGRQTVAAVKSSKSGVRDADMKNAAERESIRRQWLYVAVSPFFCRHGILTRPISRDVFRYKLPYTAARYAVRFFQWHFFSTI